MVFVTAPVSVPANSPSCCVRRRRRRKASQRDDVHARSAAITLQEIQCRVDTRFDQQPRFALFTQPAVDLHQRHEMDGDVFAVDTATGADALQTADRKSKRLNSQSLMRNTYA